MFDAGIVQGSEAMAQPLIIGKTTVYVHDDIKPTEQDGIFTYHEIQYDKDEYMSLIANKMSISI